MNEAAQALGRLRAAKQKKKLGKKKFSEHMRELAKKRHQKLSTPKP